MKFVFTILVACLAGSAVGQIQGQDFYSYRMSNLFNLNPAYTNYSDDITIYMSGLAQARGVQNNTKTFTAGMYSKLSSNQGLGGGLISDSRGAFGTTKAWLSYAYTAKFNDDMKLHLGISAGAIRNDLNLNRVEGMQYADLSDPTLNRNYYNSTQFVTGFGALLQWKDLDVSLSTPHLVTSNSSLLSYFSGYTQYRLRTKGVMSFIPSFSFQQIPSLGQVYSGFIQATFKDLIWLKGGYQSTQNIYSMIGVNTDKVRIEYSYRINTGLFTTVAGGTHELMLTLKLGKKTKKSFFNPTLYEIDYRLTKLNNKKITSSNKEAVLKEVKELKLLMQNTAINESSTEAAEEAGQMMSKIDAKLQTLQTKLNGL